MQDAVINDDFTALAELIEHAEACGEIPDQEARHRGLESTQELIRERIRAEVAARSDGLRRAIVWYEKLAEDAKRVMKQSEARAALIREYVKGEMQAAQIRSIKTATGSLTVRGNGGLQPLVVNAEELPDEYTKVTVTMPHALWSDIVRSSHRHEALDLCVQPGVTIRTEPDNARIREALAKPCHACANHGQDPKCERCGGTLHEIVPGAHLDPRAESLVVK